MSVQAIESLAQLKSLIAAGRPLVVDCYATWCGPCKQLSPVLDQLAANNKSITFAKVDVDTVKEVAEHLGISSLPTVNFYAAGVQSAQVIGFNINKIHDSIKVLQASA